MGVRDRDITVVDGKKLLNRPERQFVYQVRSGVFNDHLFDLVPNRDELAPWVWGLSERQVGVLVSEWEYTDGSTPMRRKMGGSGTSTVLYCSRHKLRHQLMALMAANGWRVSEAEYRPGHWRINACKRSVTIQRGLSVTSESYHGEVWCVTVPSGRFFVERSGKVHLTGNCHPMHRDSHRHQRSWLEYFDSIQTMARRKSSGRYMLLSHFPYRGEGARDMADRHTQYRLRNEGMPLVHGHTHDEAQRLSFDGGTAMVHVGWDAWGRPVTLDEVVGLLEGEAA